MTAIATTPRWTVVDGQAVSLKTGRTVRALPNGKIVVTKGKKRSGQMAPATASKRVGSTAVNLAIQAVAVTKPARAKKAAKVS